MKLTQEEKDKLKNSWGDWEAFHGIYDELLSKRLSELDKEYFDDLEEQIKGATFWYA